MHKHHLLLGENKDDSIPSIPSNTTDRSRLWRLNA